MKAATTDAGMNWRYQRQDVLKPERRGLEHYACTRSGAGSPCPVASSSAGWSPEAHPRRSVVSLLPAQWGSIGSFTGMGSPSTRPPAPPPRSPRHASPRASSPIACPLSPGLRAVSPRAHSSIAALLSPRTVHHAWHQRQQSPIRRLFPELTISCSAVEHHAGGMSLPVPRKASVPTSGLQRWQSRAMASLPPGGLASLPASPWQALRDTPRVALPPQKVVAVRALSPQPLAVQSGVQPSLAHACCSASSPSVARSAEPLAATSRAILASKPILGRTARPLLKG